MPDSAIDKEMQELQRLAELGRLSASLLHEISNPIAAALLHLEMSEQSASVKRARRDIRLAQRYIEAARQQVRQQARPTSFQVQPQIDQLKRVVLPIARRAGVRLEVSPVPICKLHGDPVKFQHVVTNLVVNAIEAYNGHLAPALPGLVKLEVNQASDWLTIRVHDWGKGIDPADIPHIFETFYTTKQQAGYGLGIGLAIVKQYVAVDFGGTIRVSSSRRQGTQFSVKLRLSHP